MAFLQLGMQQGHERGSETERDRASSSSLFSSFFFLPPDAILRALWYGDAMCAEQLSCSAFLFGAHGEMGRRGQEGRETLAARGPLGSESGHVRWFAEKDGSGVTE